MIRQAFKKHSTPILICVLFSINGTFWCLHYWLRNILAHFSGAFILDFEFKNAYSNTSLTQISPVCFQFCSLKTEKHRAFHVFRWYGREILAWNRLRKAKKKNSFHYLQGRHQDDWCVKRFIRWDVVVQNQQYMH